MQARLLVLKMMYKRTVQRLYCFGRLIIHFAFVFYYTMPIFFSLREITSVSLVSIWDWVGWGIQPPRFKSRKLTQTYLSAISICWTTVMSLGVVSQLKLV